MSNWNARIAKGAKAIAKHRKLRVGHRLRKALQLRAPSQENSISLHRTQNGPRFDCRFKESLLEKRGRICIFQKCLNQTVRWNLRGSALSAVSPCDGAMAHQRDGLCNVLRVLGDLCVSKTRTMMPVIRPTRRLATSWILVFRLRGTALQTSRTLKALKNSRNPPHTGWRSRR